MNRNEKNENNHSCLSIPDCEDRIKPMCHSRILLSGKLLNQGLRFPTKTLGNDILQQSAVPIGGPFVKQEMTFWNYFSLFFNTRENKNLLHNKENQIRNKYICLFKQGITLMDYFFFEGFFTRGFLKLDEKSI
jgi:hypothetical protein